MAEAEISPEEEKRLKAAVKAAKKELENIQNKIVKKTETLNAIKKDTSAFRQLKADVEGYKHRYVKFHDLDALEARVAELEKKFTKEK